MGKELVSFYTQPHTGNLFIFPVEYRISDLYSFPITCILSHQDQLIARLCYYGYEQRNAIVKGDLVCFERLNKELNTLLDSNLQANKNLIAQSDEAMLQFKKIKCAVLPKGLEFIYRDFIKRLNSLNKKLLAETLNHRLKIFSVLSGEKIFTEADLIDLDTVGSKEKSTNLDLVNNTSSKIKNANLHIELKDSEKVKNTFLDKNIIEYVNQETLIDIREQLIQLSTLSPLANILDKNIIDYVNQETLIDIREQLIQLSTQSPLANILNIDLNATPSNRRDAQLNLSYIFSEQNITRAIYLITENLMSLEKDKDFIEVDKLIELTKNTLLVETDLKFTEKAERYIKRACTHQTLELYIRKLLDIQQLNKIITFDNTLKNLAFNKMIGMEKQNKDFETREPWNGLAELVPNETEIIHDIIYLDSLSKLSDIVTKFLEGYKKSRLSTKSFKYYTYRKQYKVFKSYFKHLQTTKKEKSSGKLCKVLLTSLLKFRDTFIHDMDYGLLRTEKIPNDLIIPIKSILTESPEKQSVKDMLKFNFEDKLKNGENISVSLEGIADTKNSYTFYITLQSEVGTKLYFDFGYDQITAERAYTLMAVYNDIVYQITAEKAHKLTAVYNDIVCASKEYTELYNSIMLQFETLEKELLLLRTEHADKLKFSDITGNLYLQDKLKNAIISIQQLADKLKLTNIDLTSDELEKIKELLLVYKFVLNELYHRWYFLPADGPYDEMILPQDYPYADKPVNGINEHPFPQGADKATREIPVDINILTNVIDFCFNLWEANIFLYGGFTPQQAIKHFVNLVYEWLAKYVPTKIDKIPEYYPEDYEIYDNPDTEREDYWRLYRWIRWYAEAIVMNVPKEDEIKLKGNTYIKKLLEDLIKYFEDHHGVYGTPGTKVIDKIKGLRHKWLDKYNNLN